MAEHYQDSISSQRTTETQCSGIVKAVFEVRQSAKISESTLQRRPVFTSYIESIKHPKTKTNAKMLIKSWRWRWMNLVRSGVVSSFSMASSADVPRKGSKLVGMARPRIKRKKNLVFFLFITDHFKLDWLYFRRNFLWVSYRCTQGGR